MSNHFEYPTLEEDLRSFLGDDYSPDPTERLPTATAVEQFAEQLDNPSPSDLRALRIELMSRYDNERIGELMDTAIIGHDRQLQMLSRAGKDTILDLLAEGYFLPRIAQILDVSHAVLAQFVKKTIPSQVLAEYESLAVDRQVDNAVLGLETAVGRDEVARAKALADITLKVAKARSQKWVEKRPVGDTFVQNNYGDGDSDNPNRPGKAVAGFKLILRDPSDLKPIKPVPQVTRQLNTRDQEDPLIVNGEFRPVPHNDLDHRGTPPPAMDHITQGEAEYFDDEPHDD